MRITTRYRKQEKSIFLGFIILFGFFILPQIAGAVECNDAEHNVFTCLVQHPYNIEQCACCVVTSSGDISSKCDTSQLSHCTKPIGVYISTSGITLTDNSGHVISPNTEGSSCSCCNVGILVNDLTKDHDIGSVQISGITVKNWANGIFFWRVNSASIKSSIIENNGNGIYLFVSKNNDISSNYIRNNYRNGIVLESPPPFKSSGNVIYNNYINNGNNVQFINVNPNSWNIAQSSGTNILGDTGGDFIGGNYWATPSHTGWSESPSCACNDVTGFCNNRYTINSPSNYDNLPLCVPERVSLSVANSVHLDLIHNRINSFPDSISAAISSSVPWMVKVDAIPSTGRMEHIDELGLPTGEPLIKIMKVGDFSEGYPLRSISSELEIAHGNPGRNMGRDFDLQQEVLWSDDPGDYRITLVFTVSPDTI
jgi:parallel beta-helix repeat protein